jgi:hypothetical protein
MALEVPKLLCRHCGWTRWKSWSLSGPPSLTNSTTRTLLSLFLFVGLVVLGQVQCHGATRVRTNVLANTNQTLTALVEHVFETNDDALKILLTSLLDVIAHLAQVD